MTIDEKFKSIAFDILNSNLKDIFDKRYKDETMFIGHSGGGCFHIYLEDPKLSWDYEGESQKEYWILNPIGEHGEGGDCDIDFSGELDKEGLWLTSIDSAEGYLDYIDSFENIVKRIEDGSLAKVLKSESLMKTNELVKDIYEDELFLARLLGVLEEE
tara:strand:- start:1538 stop:2011 length:474 start_codon:yes stop_codon:yes gene_type:complete